MLGNDITERTRYIDAIEKQNGKLQEIAWTQSHIVRAPLAKMMGIVQLIAQMKIASPEALTLLGHFMKSSLELDAVIKDIARKTRKITIKSKANGI